MSLYKIYKKSFYIKESLSKIVVNLDNFFKDNENSIDDKQKEIFIKISFEMSRVSQSSKVLNDLILSYKRKIHEDLYVAKIKEDENFKYLNLLSKNNEMSMWPQYDADYFSKLLRELLQESKKIYSHWDPLKINKITSKLINLVSINSSKINEENVGKLLFELSDIFENLSKQYQNSQFVSLLALFNRCVATGGSDWNPDLINPEISNFTNFIALNNDSYFIRDGLEILQTLVPSILEFNEANKEINVSKLKNLQNLITIDAERSTSKKIANCIELILNKHEEQRRRFISYGHNS